MSQNQSLQSNPNASSLVAQHDPEVVVPAKRRQFSLADKQRILDETDRCEPGQVGAILRREGLYSSHLSTWRRQRAAGELSGRANRRRGLSGEPADEEFLQVCFPRVQAPPAPSVFAAPALSVTAGADFSRKREILPERVTVRQSRAN